MKQKITITLFIVIIFVVLFWACKEEELPKITSINKIELTITVDSTSYVFTQLKCDLNQNPKFEIEQYGFCWDTVANVTIDKESNSVENLTNQSFTENIENLLPNKTYYVKAYIQNGDVIIYSNELTIQTIDARPIVTTTDISNITATSAQSGGTVTAYETLFPITQRGVCWAKTQNTTIADSLTTNGTGNGTFTNQLQNLDIGATYYVRAYAINSEGISYGKEKSFTTLDGIPELTTDSIKNITATSATFYGNVIENDGLEILEKGFCWNTSTNPTIENNFQMVTGNTLGSFNVDITGLEINTTYYVKAYIKNTEGTYYGDELIFSTNDGLSSVTTNSISNVTAISASCSGTIIDNGEFAVTARGTCWSINENPTISDSYTSDGTSMGDFTSNLTELEANTTYYVRAYSINTNGTTYGNQLSFTTEDGIPDLTTISISNITAISASSGGNITDDGGAPITERGICWSTNQNPTISNIFISNGSGTGSFTADLTGLNANTTYYVRVYAKNAVGITYGNELSLTTNDGIPTLTTTDISNITAISATSGGKITDDGGAPITKRGVCWALSENPTVHDITTIDGSGIGNYSSNLTGLDVSTTYYVRAYAINSVDTAYGNQVSFTTDDGIPTISTLTVSDITATSASSGGEITDNGGLTITARGVCWSTGSNPTINDNKTSNGTGTGSFTSSLTGLSLNTTYYVRSYATNANDTVYGNEFSFITKDGIPKITTTEVSDITETTAASGGNITDDGGFDITARGVCWSISQNPTIADSYTTDGTGTGSFTSSLTGLISGTTYYIRAYATNSEGTTYGEQKSFATLAEVGDYAFGGVVFYIFQNGDAGYVEGEQHGLVCTVSDQSTGAEWGCYTVSISGADGTAIGTGAQNTIDIEAGCTITGIAADICANLDLNGYSDWFLASKDELNLMFQNKATIDATAQANDGGSFATYYWSSTEYDSNHAWFQNFGSGDQLIDGKHGMSSVRAIRVF